MFKVRFPLVLRDPLVLKNALVNLILPKGYYGVFMGLGDFDIYSHYGHQWVGECKIVSSGLVFAVDEETEEGAKFWLEFGKMHPELNPAQIRFGIVSETDGLFRLEEKPAKMPGNALGNVEKYAKVGDCYFVKFLTGHLEKELLAVMKMQPILPDGTLGEDLGEAKLPLWGE